MVELILRELAEGASETDQPEDYPHLTSADIRAAVAYGAAAQPRDPPRAPRLLLPRGL